MNIHKGKQTLILSPEGYILDSVQWNIYLHAFQLASGEEIHCRKDDLICHIKTRFPDASLADAIIPSGVNIPDAPTTALVIPFSVCRADGKPAIPSNFPE